MNVIEILLCVAAFVALLFAGPASKRRWPLAVFIVAILAAMIVVFVPQQIEVNWLKGNALAAAVCVSLMGLLAFLFRGVHQALSAVTLILGGLFGLLVLTSLPEFADARRAARRSQCLSNMHHVVMAIYNHPSTSMGGPLPAPVVHGTSEFSWRYTVLPVVLDTSVYKRYRRDKPWNDPANREFSTTRIAPYTCPSNPNPRDAEGRYYTAYALLTGPGTMYDGDKPPRLNDIGGSLSQTILLAEACGANIVWNEPRDIDVSRELVGVNLPGRTRGSSAGWLSGGHYGGVNVAFADGSARTLSANIDPAVLKALATIDHKDNPPIDRINP